MSRFYAEIQGSRGEATRRGTAKSGINGHVRGWNIGGIVDMYADDQDEDVVSIRLTGGSNRANGHEILQAKIDGDGSFQILRAEIPGHTVIEGVYDEKQLHAALIGLQLGGEGKL